MRGAGLAPLPVSDSPGTAIMLEERSLSAAGKRQLFLPLFLRNQQRLYAYILTMLPNRADADDALQEASLAMWDKFDEQCPPNDFLAWARRIAYYKVLDVYKRGQRGRVLFSQEMLERVAETAAEQAETLQLDDRREALAGCIEKLGTARAEPAGPAIRRRSDHALDFGAVGALDRGGVQGGRPASAITLRLRAEAAHSGGPRMIPSFPEQNELRALLDALCEESISSEQMRRLEQIVLERPEAEAFYVQFMSFHADLIQTFRGQPVELKAAPSSERKLRGRFALDGNPRRGRGVGGVDPAGDGSLAAVAAGSAHSGPGVRSR